MPPPGKGTGPTLSLIFISEDGCGPGSSIRFLRVNGDFIEIKLIVACRLRLLFFLDVILGGEKRERMFLSYFLTSICMVF